jgi:hypothetical protein
MTRLPQRPLTKEEECEIIARLWAWQDRKEFAALAQDNSYRLEACRDRFAELRHG